jgi:hypothetical protein
MAKKNKAQKPAASTESMGCCKVESLLTIDGHKNGVRSILFT